MKMLFLIVGLLLMLLGLHWIGQGTEYFPWPRNPAMDGHIEFVYYGAIAAAVGIGLAWYSRR
jgi:uncharacterized membrane protein